MNQFIKSCVTTASLAFLIATASAPTKAQSHWYYDTVIYNGRILTRHLPSGVDTCDWVRRQGLFCEYERWDPNTRTHYVRSERFRDRYWHNPPHWRQQNFPFHLFNRTGGSGSGCIYEDRNIRILCR